MYAERFRLDALPFENVPDPKFFFDKGDFGRVRDRIEASLFAGRGLMLVTGPIGSGKTTISQMIMSGLHRDVGLVWLAEPPNSSDDLFLFIAQEIGLDYRSSDRVFLIRDIRAALMDIVSRGGRCLVVIDESHLMSEEVMNGIRLLNNLEDGPKKLIQILLLGQDEILKKINSPGLEPFRQRIADLEILGKMWGERIREYVLHRIAVVGGSADLFSDHALQAVAKAFGSGGIPRKINLLCNVALEIAFEDGKERVDVREVWKAADALGLGKEVFFYMKEVERTTVAESKAVERPTPRTEQPTFVTLAPEDNVPKTEVPEVPSGPDAFRADEARASFFGEKEHRQDGGGLVMPFVMLLVSLLSLFASFLFYFKRSGLQDTVACLEQLLKF